MTDRGGGFYWGGASIGKKYDMTAVFEPTCANTWWAHVHHLLSVSLPTCVSGTVIVHHFNNKMKIAFFLCAGPYCYCHRKSVTKVQVTIAQ